MAKITKKLPITIPKTLAERCTIGAGDEVELSATADGLRIRAAHGRSSSISISERLALFDASTRRQEKRQSGRTLRIADKSDRGWKREDLYTRGGTR
jgi:AbrB family looped-hinge helix DNA binding protein